MKYGETLFGFAICHIGRTSDSSKNLVIYQVSGCSIHCLSLVIRYRATVTHSYSDLLQGVAFHLCRFNPLSPELNPICYLLALLGGHHFLHVSRIRVKLLTFRRLMSYIYGAPILDVFRSHTTTQHSR